MKTSHSILDKWEFFEPNSKQWLQAIVPGCIHMDLLRNRLISEPFWGSNERELQGIQEKNWNYRCQFLGTGLANLGENTDLVAEGLDTIAEIRLNDQLIGRSENMFVLHRFDVRKALQPGINTLEILFASPMTYIRERQNSSDIMEWNDPVGGSSHIRKQQCSFGWDWAPRYPTSGIYLPIRLETWSGNRFESVGVKQKHSTNHVDLYFTPVLANSQPCKIRGSVSFNGQIVAEVVQNTAQIDAPLLWWPNGHGEQPLYDVELELIDETGTCLDKWTRRIGLRTILLDRHRDEFGESFQFVINGRAIFAKGANWIPAHSFVSEANHELYDNLLSSAVDAHMNMLRVWGGGIYEKEEFYDLCDEKGILVWQDFMFACASYPGTPDFLSLVRQEAVYQVSRLAHRPCLALWCGNNEIELMPSDIISTSERKDAYDHIFYHLLPDVVSACDGITPYWPSSPHNPDGYESGPNNECAGDSHFWDVWHARQPVKVYEDKKFRFCSEFGMQSYSSPEVAATYCDPAHFNAFGPEMENHQKNSAGNLIILDYISRLYRFPKDYASLAYLSQLNQAYCMKVGIEHFRRSMPRTMGALYWQLNDCWPTASWSSIEFQGNWKAMHYQAKRFFAPELVSIHVLGDEKAGKNNYLESTVTGVDIYSVYDRPDEEEGTLFWRLEHFEKGTLRHGQETVQLKYGQSLKHLHLNLVKDLQLYGAGSLYVRAELHTKRGLVSRQTAFLTAPKYLQLQSSPVSHHLIQISPGNFLLKLTSKAFHHAVHLNFQGIDSFCNDNYFDLYPEESKSVNVCAGIATTLQELQTSLRIRSLVDSY